MSTIKLILSDLHLADGHPILDSFGEQQQAALEGLLRAAAPGGPLGNAEDVELIINGDCFDFLAIPPYVAHNTTNPVIALEKWKTIPPMHLAFFEALRRFLRLPGRHVTFITGNHDIELGFEEIRAAIRAEICGEDQFERICFSEARFYRPLPDVHIEHGHHFDFWNHAGDLWDENGSPFSHSPQILTLPVGTQYFQWAAHPISVRYPYFDRFDPSIGSARQIALLCLLDPDSVVETAHRTMKMLSFHREALEGLSTGEERIPAKLFAQAMMDFAAFQQDMIARKPEWQPVEAFLRAHPTGQGDGQGEAFAEFVELCNVLTLSPVEAVRAILAPKVYPMGESVAHGMRNVLRSDPTLRYAIAGHTHMMRRDPVNNGSQVYLNTASWTKRQAVPTSDEITPTLVDWLREPGNQADPLHDITQAVFALVRADDGGSSDACLCAWEGGEQGYYRVLPEGKE